LKEARVRRNLIGGELAAGRNPGDLLRAMTEQPRRLVHTVQAWADKFVDSRIDVDTNTIKNYRSALKKVSAEFGDRDPVTITVARSRPGWRSSRRSTSRERCSCT
jgi:hypothetical protein